MTGPSADSNCVH